MMLMPPYDIKNNDADKMRRVTANARVHIIAKQIEDAAENGAFQLRVDSLMPEQKEWCIAKGFKLNEIMQKQGTQYDIIWE